jgi:outer membrane protein assembly factor BamB
MSFDFGGFETADFDLELEDFEVKRKKKFDRIWQWSKGGSVTFHVLNKNIAYFGSMDSYLYAVDVHTGKTVWRFRTGGGVFGTPSYVINGMIAVGSFDGFLYLIDTHTGKEVWRFKTGGPISVGPTLTENSVYVSSKDGYIYSVGLDGILKWRFKTGDEIACGITNYRNRILFGGFDGYFYCINRDSGKETWRFKTGAEIVHDRPCPVHENIVYFGSFDNYLYAVNVETGKEIWRFKAGKYGVDGPPSIYGDMLFFPSREGIVFAVSLEGKEIWKFRAGGLIISIIIHEDKIYFTSEDGNMYVLSLEGKELWRFRFGEGGSYDFPSIYKNMILVGSMDCHFYAIDLNTGREIWRVATSSQARSTAPPPHEEFSIELKKETHIEDTMSEEKYKKKKEETVSLSDYKIESEYSTTSEYKQKSDYDVNWVIFEEIRIPEHDFVNDNFLTFARKT